MHTPFIFAATQLVKRMNLFVLNPAASLRYQHVAEPLNYIPIIAIDYVPIGGSHLETILVAEEPLFDASAAVAHKAEVPRGAVGDS